MNVKNTAGLKNFVLIRQIRTFCPSFFLDFEKRHFIFAPNRMRFNILQSDAKRASSLEAKRKENERRKTNEKKRLIFLSG